MVSVRIIVELPLVCFVNIFYIEKDEKDDAKMQIFKGRVLCNFITVKNEFHNDLQHTKANWLLINIECFHTQNIVGPTSTQLNSEKSFQDYWYVTPPPPHRKRLEHFEIT